MKTTVKFVLSTLVAAAAMNSTMLMGKEVHVGPTGYATWGEAYNNTSAPGLFRTDTIIIDENRGHVGYVSGETIGRKVIIGSGSVLGVQRNLLKIDKSFTIKAGASFNVAPHDNYPNPYTHIDGGQLYIGEAGASSRATMNFDTNSVAVLYDGWLEANNADIIVGDLGMTGTAKFTDSNISVNGVVAFGKEESLFSSALGGLYFQSMTNTAMTVKGHALRNENTYYSTEGTILHKLTMTNSSITVDDGVEGTVAEAVTIKNLTMKSGSALTVEAGTAVKVTGTFDFDNSTLKAGALEIGTSGKFNVSGNSSLNLSSVSGNAINIIGNTTLTDSSIGGNVAVGYGNYTEQPATLTLKGTSSISGALYVGDEKTVDAYKLNVNGSATIGSLYSRTESIVNVSEADLSIGYWQNKGKATIDNASVEVTGVNFYVYNNDSESLASITLKNGATLTAMGLANNIGLVLGNTEATPAKGHAALYLEGGSTAKLSELQLRPTVNGDKTYKIEVAAKEGSTIDVRDAVVVGAGATISLTDSTLKTTSVRGEGLILGNGTVNLSADSISTQVFVGGYYDAEGNRQYNDGEALRSKLELDDVSGNGVMIKDKEFRVNNADITLNADVTAELGDKYFYIRESVLNLNGHTVNLNTGKFIANGINIIGEGTINAMDSNDPACFQNVKATIGSGVTFNTHTFHAYTDLDLYGNASATGTALVGVNGKEPFDSSKPWIDNANMTVWGEFNAGNMTIQGASGNIVASKLIVKDGGKVSVSGTLTNNGVLEVDAKGTLTANAITGSGDVVLAGTINVVGGVFKADDLTIVAGATLNFGAVEKGVTLMATREVISFDFNTLTIIATDVAADKTLDLSEVITGTGADAFWAALADKEEAPEFTVVDSNTGKEFTAVYSSENGGTVTVIPEPSTFGLLAGLGALVLVGTRRRRK